MNQLYLCEYVMNEDLDNTVMFFCIGKPDEGELVVLGHIALCAAFGDELVLLRSDDGGYTIPGQYEIPEVRFARCPRQILSAGVMSTSIVFDVGRFRAGDVLPLSDIPDDVN